MADTPNASLTAVVADDEPALRSYLLRCLRDAWPDLEIVGEAGNGLQALEMIQTLRPAVAFLDVRMPGLSGLEVASRVNGQCEIVFVTAYGDHAVDAFERAAIDYLVKPVSVERLQTTATRIEARVRSESPGPDRAKVQSLVESLQALLGEAGTTLSAAGSPGPKRLNWLQVSRRDEVQLIPTSDVDFFLASDKVTLVIHASGEWVIRTALKELESQLDPEVFWRVHRNAIVRVGAIAKVVKDAQGQLALRLHGHGRTISVSRPYAHRFKAL